MILDAVEPLDRMPDDGRHAVIIEDATFAWSKVGSGENGVTAATEDNEEEANVRKDGKFESNPRTGRSKLFPLSSYNVLNY